MLSAFACSNILFYWREGSHLFRTGGKGVQEILGGAPELKARLCVVEIG